MTTQGTERFEFTNTNEVISWLDYFKLIILDIPYKVEGYDNELNEKFFTHIDRKGRIHRNAGPAIEYESGKKGWYKHGKKHRIGGPAIENSEVSEEEWWVNGFPHRADGPAFISKDPLSQKKILLWFFKGKFYKSMEKWAKAAKVSDEKFTFLKLKYFDEKTSDSKPLWVPSIDDKENSLTKEYQKAINEL